MRSLLVAMLLLLGLAARPGLAQDQPHPPEVQQILDGLSPRSGMVEIAPANATLDLGNEYIFYGAEDARAILLDLWDNPPLEAEGVLGLVMPAGATPLSGDWAGVVTFEQSGWVSSDDARGADYDALLVQLQEANAQANAQRRAEGHAAVDIVGWAQAPQYDSVSHAVIWARELDYADAEVNTLNYDLRMLGSEGVLSINMVSVMPELAEIRLAARDFADHARFDEGFRYEDFDAATDEEAGYGIAGLVAGGAGLAVAKKAGLFALIFNFAKPLALGLLVLVGAFAVFSRRRSRAEAGRGGIGAS